ncbi:HNH endonuclease signature motif containing protein [Angustibacter peucedani]
MTTTSATPGVGGGLVANALAAVDAAIDALAAVPAWGWSSDDVAELVVRVEHQLRRLAAVQLTAVAEASTRGLPSSLGHRRSAHWLTSLVPGMADHAARRLERRARDLHTSPLAADTRATRAAVAAGDISLEQADVISDTVASLLPPRAPAGTVDEQAVAEVEQLLLVEATTTDPVRMQRVATSLRCRLDPDADDRLARDEVARDHARSFTLATLPSRMVHVTGLLTPEAGAAVRSALDAWSAPRPATDGTADHRTASQRRHDALEALAGTALATPSLLPTTHGSPFRVVTTVARETLEAALTGQPVAGLEPARLDDGTALSSSRLAELVCTAELVPVMVDEHGGPLDVGDTQYAFPPRIRAAIVARDRHCTWSRCTAPAAWCHVHHMESFADGGPTSERNGALVCGLHHRYVHATGQRGRVVDGVVRWDGARAPGASAGAGPTENWQTARTRAARAVEHLVRRWRARQQQ